MQGCDSRYRSAKYVKRHLSTREEKAGHGLTDLSPYTCPLCPTEVLGKEEMRQHKRAHRNATWCRKRPYSHQGASRNQKCSFMIFGLFARYGTGHISKFAGIFDFVKNALSDAQRRSATLSTHPFPFVAMITVFRLSPQSANLRMKPLRNTVLLALDLLSLGNTGMYNRLSCPRNQLLSHIRAII